MESCCGKNCDLCASREELGCAGCREDMGRRFEGPCEIAACCREKGHGQCATCGYGRGCSLLAGRDEVPRRELRRRQEERERQCWLREQAPVLAKWLGCMFWLMIVQAAVQIPTIEVIAGAFPALASAGKIAGAVCSLAMALCLWMLGPVLREYRRAALCHFILALGGGVSLLVDEEVVMVLSLGVIALGLYRDYLTYHAHARVLEGADGELAKCWLRLWKWNIWAICGLAGSILVTAILGFLGLLLMLALSLGLLALSVLGAVYLWRTARVFREYRPPAEGGTVCPE